MQQFIMPDGDRPEFHKLPQFVQGYIEAAFWLAPDGSCEGDDDFRDKGFADMPDETVRKILEECEAFRNANAEAIDALIADGGPKDEDGVPKDHYDERKAGRDFWLTRNGHGVGYWDRGFDGEAGEIAERLSEAAEAAGATDLYLGDDGLVYEFG